MFIRLMGTDPKQYGSVTVSDDKSESISRCAAWKHPNLMGTHTHTIEKEGKRFHLWIYPQCPSLTRVLDGSRLCSN